MSTIKPMFWMDLETTGLEARTNEVLEIGCMVTDQWGEEADTFHILVKHDPKVYNWNMSTDTIVKQMHAKSGLFQEVINNGAGARPAEAWGELGNFLADYGLDGHPMCGSSVQFDRQFMDWHAPQAIMKKFHYRNIDLSTITETMKLVAPDLHEKMLTEVPKQEKHRVIADLQDTVAGYKWILENYLRVIK